MIKKILVIITILLGIFIGIGFILPSTYLVKRTTIISAPPNQIYPLLVNFSTWEKWSPWASSDSEQKVTITGQAGTIGHEQLWDGKINGKGSMTLISLNENNNLEMKLKFIEPDPMEAIAKFTLEDKGTSTLVIWETTGQLNNFFERYFGLFIDSLLGKDFEMGLNQLKILAEQK
jgi:hypothetical protein